MIRFHVKLMFNCGTIVDREYFAFTYTELQMRLREQYKGFPITSMAIVSQVACLGNYSNVVFVDFKNKKVA